MFVKSQIAWKCSCSSKHMSFESAFGTVATTYLTLPEIAVFNPTRWTCFFLCDVLIDYPLNPASLLLNSVVENLMILFGSTVWTDNISISTFWLLRQNSFQNRYFEAKPFKTFYRLIFFQLPTSGTVIWSKPSMCIVWHCCLTLLYLCYTSCYTSCTALSSCDFIKGIHYHCQRLCLWHKLECRLSDQKMENSRVNRRR